MGKSHLFSFPLSGRKNVAKQGECLTGPPPRLSKAQRILGTEAIDLNICSQPKHVSSTDLSYCSQSHIPYPLSNLDVFCTRDEGGCQESMANISGKASSILGISPEDLESRKSLSLSVRSHSSMGAPSGGKSWTIRSNDYSRNSSLSSQGVTQSWSLNRESGSDNFQTHRNCSITHIATYIDANLDHISELPDNASSQDRPLEYIHRKFSASRTATNGRPRSSASCPVNTNPMSSPLPKNMGGIYSEKNVKSRLSAYDLKKPQFRSEHKSLPPPPHTSITDTHSLRQNSLETESLVGQTKINISSQEIDDNEEHDPVPNFSRSSQHSISISQNDSEPTTPLAEVPLLTIPNFMDLKLSGPWNENQGDPRFSRTHFCANSIPSKSNIRSQPVIHTVPSTSSFNSHYFDILGEYESNPPTSIEISVPSPPCQHSVVDKDLQKSHLMAQDHSGLSEIKQFGEPNLPESRQKYVNSRLNVGSNRHSSSSNSSSSTQSDDDRMKTLCVPLCIDISAKGWDYSSLSSLCTDFDSASSATLLKNEPVYHQASEENPQDNRFSSIYPSTALMEVAQVAQVIRRAPVKEMKVKRKEKPMYNSTNDSSLNVCELSADMTME